MSIPTFQQMWSMYLFNSMSAPKGDDLLNESLLNKIRSVNEPQFKLQRNEIQISAKDFMTDGAGKFVNGAVFSVVQNFFNETKLTHDKLKQIADNSTGIVQVDDDGTIRFSLKQMALINQTLSTTVKQAKLDENGNKIPIKDKEGEYETENVKDSNGNDVYLDIDRITGNENNIFDGVNPHIINIKKPISQRQFRPDGESNFDFAVRVQMFETTGFNLGKAKDGEYDQNMMFVIHPDGTRQIENFAITPSSKDNFDFVGGHGELGESIGNELNDFLTDPSNVRHGEKDKVFGIGRTVPIKYIGLNEIEEKTYTKQDFNTDQRLLDSYNYIESVAIKELSKNAGISAKRLFEVLLGSLEMYKQLYDENIISFKDGQGRTVYYGTADQDTLDLDNVTVKDLPNLLEIYALIDETISLPFGTTSLVDIEDDRVDNLKVNVNNKNKITFVAGAGNDVIYGLDKAGGLIFADKDYNDDRIFGGIGEDILYGRRGNDTLDGGLGNDTLNGGEGNDTLIDESGDDKYEFVGEYGHDTIYDNDGKGEISIDYIPLSAEEQITDSSWSTSNENYMINIAKTEYNVTGYYTLIIKHKYDSNKSITIQNWKQGDFGLNLIHLGEEHKTQENTGFVFGNDSHNIIYDQQYVAAFAGDDLIQTTQYDDIVIADDVIMLVADKGAKYVVYSPY